MLNITSRALLPVMALLLLVASVSNSLADSKATNVVSVDDEVAVLYARAAILEECQLNPDSRCESAKTLIYSAHPELYFHPADGDVKRQQVLVIFAGEAPPFATAILYHDKDGRLAVGYRGYWAGPKTEFIDMFLESGDFTDPENYTE